MNVLLSTVPRSGSTLLFNICRLLFEQLHGKDNVYAIWHELFKENMQKQHNIVKTHEKNEKYLPWSHKKITSIRDIRYVIASYFEFNQKFKINNPEILKDVCNAFKTIIDNGINMSDYVFVYEEYFKNQKKVILELAACLELPLEKINVPEILNKIDEIKNRKYNEFDRTKTQMHPNHISPNSNKDIKERITQEQLAFIESNCSGFLKKHGYKAYNTIKIL
jgi:hypothetical protein